MGLEIGGFAQLTRSDAGTAGKVVVRGLEPGTTYAAHLHNAPCSDPNPGGAHYKNDPAGPQRDSGTWSAYPYTGPMFKTGPGIPVYASDGVENNALAQGMVVYRPIIPKPGRSKLVDHLNPQTMEE